MKKLWYIMIFYSHIESYEHLNRNHMKERKWMCFIDTGLGAHNLGYLQFGIGMWQSPRQGLSTKHWDDTVFLDVLAPANGRW